MLYLSKTLTICENCRRAWNGVPPEDKCPVCKHPVKPL